MADQIFLGMKDYGFMHSSHFTTAAIVEATKLGLPSMKEYFELRLKNVEHSFDSKTQKGLKASRLIANPNMGYYSSLTT